MSVNVADIDGAYDKLDKSLMELFNANESKLDAKRAYDEREAELRRKGLEGKNKEERDANLKHAILPEAKKLELANRIYREKKHRHEENALEVERVRLIVRVMEVGVRIHGGAK